MIHKYNLFERHKNATGYGGLGYHKRSLTGGMLKSLVGSTKSQLSPPPIRLSPGPLQHFVEQAQIERQIRDQLMSEEEEYEEGSMDSEEYEQISELMRQEAEIEIAQQSRLRASEEAIQAREDRLRQQVEEAVDDEEEDFSEEEEDEEELRYTLPEKDDEIPAGQEEWYQDWSESWAPRHTNHNAGGLEPDMNNNMSSVDLVEEIEREEEEEKERYRQIPNNLFLLDLIKRQALQRSVMNQIKPRVAVDPSTISTATSAIRIKRLPAGAGDLIRSQLDIQQMIGITKEDFLEWVMSEYGQYGVDWTEKNLKDKVARLPITDVKKDRYIPSVSRPELSELTASEISTLKNAKLDVSIIGQDYKHIIPEINASLTNPYTLITTTSLDKIYSPIPTKYKKDLKMNPKIQQFYDTVNYESGKDFEDLFTKNKRAVEELIKFMSHKLTPAQIQHLTTSTNVMDFVVNSDDIWETAGHKTIGDNFTYDAFINIIIGGSFKESFCIEFKKYAMYAHYGYLSKLKEDSKKYFDTYFYTYIKTIQNLQSDAKDGDSDALDELHFELDRIKGTNGKIDKVKLWSDYSSAQLIVGLPVKFTKFNQLTDALIDKDYIVNTDEAGKHFLKIAEKGKFLVTLGPDKGASNIIWSKDTPKRAIYAKIIQDHLLKTGQSSDIVFVIGLFDAIVICNISQKMREGYIIDHPFNSLQVALSAYEKSGDLTTWDHFLIPIEWFYSLNLD